MVILTYGNPSLKLQDLVLALGKYLVGFPMEIYYSKPQAKFFWSYKISICSCKNYYNRILIFMIQWKLVYSAESIWLQRLFKRMKNQIAYEAVLVMSLSLNLG